MTPTKHEGFAARQLERRGGKSTICQVNRDVKAINEARHQLEFERRSVIVEMERERIDRALRQMQDDIQTIRNYRSDRTKNNEMAAGEKSKMQKQIEAIRRRKRTEKAAANKAAHDKTEAQIQSTAGKIEEIKASRFKAASNRAVETAIQAIEKGSEVAKDVIKNLTPEDVGKLAEAAQKTFVKELHPKSNLSQINNIAANALKIICDCAAAGDRGAAAFLHKSKQELGLPKDWEYMTEADKDEARLRRAYSDDYSDDKSLMSDYKPQMPTPEPPAPKKPKRVRKRDFGGR